MEELALEFMVPKEKILEASELIEECDVSSFMWQCNRHAYMIELVDCDIELFTEIVFLFASMDLLL